MFEKLTAYHVPVHLHANNFADVMLVQGVPIPDVLELSFLRRDLGSFSASLDGPDTRRALTGPTIPIGRISA